MSEIPFPLSPSDRALADRRHGPEGLSDYRSYKPWLRDEHDFRCVYCLAREAWDLSGPSSADKFTIDHLESRNDAPGRATDYDNLCYSCAGCNSRKNSASLPPEMIDRPLRHHLEVAGDGTLTAKTVHGEDLTKLLRLNNPKRIEWRALIIQHYEEAKAAIREGRSSPSLSLFAYPNGLEDLAALRPRSNFRADGVAQSAFARRSRGELPTFY